MSLPTDDLDQWLPDRLRGVVPPTKNEEMRKIFTFMESADEEFFLSVHFRNCPLVPFTNLFSVPKNHDYLRGQ